MPRPVREIEVRLGRIVQRLWKGFDAIVSELAPKNAALLAERDRIQLEMDAWHKANPGPIADMAAYPWVVPYERQGQSLDEFPNVKRWFHAIRERPATVRAYAKADEINPKQGPMTEEDKKVLFGQTSRNVVGIATSAMSRS